MMIFCPYCGASVELVWSWSGRFCKCGNFIEPVTEMPLVVKNREKREKVLEKLKESLRKQFYEK